MDGEQRAVKTGTGPVDPASPSGELDWRTPLERPFKEDKRNREGNDAKKEDLEIIKNGMGKSRGVFGVAMTKQRADGATVVVK